MGLGKTYSTKYLLDSNNNSGVAGQVLISTSTGIDWSDGSAIIGGPYLPLSAGSTKPLSGVLYAGQGVKFTGGTIAQATAVLHTNNILYFRGGSSGFYLQNGDGSDGYYISPTYHKWEVNSSESMRLTSTGLGIGTTSPGTALQVGGLDDGSNYDITVGWNAVSSQAVGTKRSALTFKTSQTGVNNEDIYKWDIAMVTAPATASSEPFGSDLAFLRSTRSSTSVDETTMILTQLGNVGIGTTSPGSKLQVYSTALRDISIFGHGTQAQNNWQAEHAFFISAGQGVIIGKANASNNTNRLHLFYNTSNGDAQYMLHNTSSTNIVKLNTNGDSFFNGGNVGIGTTSPITKLNVAGNIAVTATKAYRMYNAANNGWGEMSFIEADNRIQFNRGIQNSGVDWRLSENSASSYVCALQGNFGIGTTSPTDPLTVTSTSNSLGIRLNYPVTNSLVYPFYVGNAAGTSYVRANNTAIAFKKNGGACTLKTEGSTNDLIIESASNLSFKTNGTLNTRMTILAAGNVGIGTTAPTSSVHINGLQTNSGSTSAHLPTGTMRLNFAGASSADEYGASLVFTQRWWTNSTGEVAMGQIAGVKETGNGNYGGGLAFFTSNNTSNNLLERLRINELGNVGIATTSPTQKLDTPNIVIGGPSIAANYRANSTMMDNLGGIARFYSLGPNTTTGGSYQFNSLSSNATAGAGAVMTILNSGNVGIGTTSPGATLPNLFNSTTPKVLQISSATGSTDSGILIRRSDNATGIDIWNDSNNGVSYIDNRYGSITGDLNFRVQTNGTPKTVMTITGDEKIGIGTTNPTNKLHIQGSQATVYSSTDTGGQASAGTTINNTNTSGNTNNFSQLLFTVGTNNNSVSRIVAIRSGSDASDLAFVGKSTAGVAEYMRIKSGGNVGIGINNPSALLEVRKGSISGQIAKFSAINPHIVIESTTAGNAVLHLKPNATGSKSGQFKVTAGNGYNFLWSNDASGTGEIAYMDLDTSTTGGGDLTVKGDVIAYGSPSDKKYKENIKPIESALDKAMQLQGVTFDWKDSESILEIKEDIGFIAQDVQEVLPELVRDNGKGNLSLRYQGITPILLEAIKELKAEIEELKLNNCNCNK